MLCACGCGREAMKGQRRVYAYGHRPREAAVATKRKAAARRQVTFRAAHPDRVKAKNAAYYQANREREIERERAWREANPEKAKAKDARNNAKRARVDVLANARVQKHRRRGVPFTEEAREMLPVLLADPCVYCGAPSEEVEHIVPVARGGSGSWENLAGACSSCNSRKGSRSLLRFMLRRR